MKTVMTLAPRLAAERLRGARGGGVLDVLAVIAFAVSAWLSLTVAGGTWMFVARWQHPSPELQAAFGDAPGAEGSLTQTYVVLAIIACALLVMPVLSLGAGAARLGARGRSRRLASLRLIGMTGREVVAISVVETLVQAAMGVMIGAGLWLISLAAWQAVSFQGQAIAWHEMLLPWWLMLSVVAVLLVLAMLSTVLGLRQLRISPLGVAMQQTPGRLRGWRLIVFLGALIGFVAFAQVFIPVVRELNLTVYAMLAGMILLVVGGLNLVGPWVLQLLARAGVPTSSPARLIAARRIIDDPRSAWRNVSGIALLGLISAFVALMPSDPADYSADETAFVFMTDVRTGIIITLGIGLVVAATSTLVNQAAIVVDRADESVAMDRAGYPRPLFAAIRRDHVLAPLLITLAVSVGVGTLLSAPFIAALGVDYAGLALLAATIGLGVILSVAAAEACRPVQNLVLNQAHRRND